MVISQLVIALLIANIKEKAFSSITWWKLVKLYLDVKWAINCLQIRKCDSIKKMRRILRQKQVVFANIEHLWLIFIWKLLCCMKHLKICKLHSTNWYFLVWNTTPYRKKLFYYACVLLSKMMSFWNCITNTNGKGNV